MPNREALDFYNSKYFSNAHGGTPTNRLATSFHSAIAKLRVTYLTKCLVSRGVSVTKALEIGPGTGFFAKHWLKLNPESVYFANETDQSCHDFLVKAGVHLVAKQLAEQVDLVIMSHVLEHTSNPAEFIQEATSKLRLGGVLFIEVPCQDWAHKDLDEPHILFFEKKSLHRLLIDQGFIDVELGYFGKTIHKLKSQTPIRALWDSLRSKMLAQGLVFPFARSRPGMESLIDPLERAVVAPFRAHEESEDPAWWLRAIAIKGTG
jgi:SAM-dependent methyltransferase